jgi:hypothetical protein
MSAALFLRKIKIKKIGRNCQNSVFISPLVSLSYSNDVASIVVRLQGTFRNCQGYFNDTWCEAGYLWATEYAQRFFYFRDLTYFVAYIYSQAACLTKL